MELKRLGIGRKIQSSSYNNSKFKLLILFDRNFVYIFDFLNILLAMCWLYSRAVGDVVCVCDWKSGANFIKWKIKCR